MASGPPQPPRNRSGWERFLNRIYLDHNATSPLLPEVARGMTELLECGTAGNPSSLHQDGRGARRILEDARDRVAAALSVEPAEIYFTSGGTESNNLAICGLVTDHPSVSASATEHPSILEPVKQLHGSGRPGNIIPVSASGRVDLDQVPEEGLVSVHWFNNETGIAQNLDSIAERVHRKGGRFHTDGAQGFFRTALNLKDSPLDAATITAHKAGGPSGVGALWIRKGFLQQPFIHGGPQEKKIRPGTENLLAIHGMGILAETSFEKPAWNRNHLEELRSLFLETLKSVSSHNAVAQDQDDWPGCINLSFEGVHAETLLVRLDMEGISASSGSACSSGAREPSHVLKAMAIPENQIRGSIRISMGPHTTAEQIEKAARTLGRLSEDLRRHSTGAPPVS